MSRVSSPSCVTGRKQVAPPPLTVRYRRLQGRFIWVRPKTSAAALGGEIPQQHSSQGFQVGGGVVRAARPLRLPSERRLRTARHPIIVSLAETGSGAQSVFGLRPCEEQEHRNVGPR
jgi:hypothetical protein